MDRYEDIGLPHVDGSEQADAVSAAEVLTGELVDAVPIGPYMATVTMHRRRGGWVACATVETSAGPLRWCGVASEQEVAERLARQHLRRGGATAGIDFGSLFRNMGQAIQRGTQQLARNRALRSTVSDIRRTLDRPELQPVLAVAQQIPYLGQAVTAFRAATTIVDDLLGGDPQTRSRVVRIRQAAQQGNPIAREAMQVIETVLQAQQRMTRQRAQGGRRPQRRRPTQRAHTSGAAPRRRRRVARAARGATASVRRGRVRRGAPRVSPTVHSAWLRAEHQWARRMASTPLVPPPPQ